MTGSAKHSAEMQRNGFMKDSFGFKMSKKVAELTQVRKKRKPEICLFFLGSEKHQRKKNVSKLKVEVCWLIYKIVSK